MHFITIAVGHCFFFLELFVIKQHWNKVLFHYNRRRSLYCRIVYKLSKMNSLSSAIREHTIDVPFKKLQNFRLFHFILDPIDTLETRNTHSITVFTFLRNNVLQFYDLTIKQKTLNK